MANNNSNRNSRSKKSGANRNYDSKRNTRNYKDTKSKGYEKDKKYDEKATTGQTEAANSSDWYGGKSALMDKAARVSFGNALGMPVTLANSSITGNYGIQKGSFNASGIMSISTIPIPGVAKEWNDPINMAARQMYTFVRHVNSGHTNYEACDLMMYILSMDSLYTYYAWMCRLYGTMRTVILRNRYLPEGILLAQGGNYKDLADNIANFLYYINVFAARVNSMCVPKSFNIFKRHMWLYSNIYADQPIDKCQMYVLRPTFFWEYDPDHSSQKPAMIPRYVVPDDMWLTGATFEQIRACGDALLDSVVQNEDFNIMSGDILKAYGGDIFNLSPIDSNYSVVPVYEPEFLVQMHNASVHEITLENLNDWVITQDLKEGSANLGCLTFQPSWKASYTGATVDQLELVAPEIGAACFSHMLDLPLNDPTAEHLAIASRMHNSVKVEWQTELGDGNSVKATLETAGSEIIAGIRIIMREPTTGEFEFYRYYPGGLQTGSDVRLNGTTIGQQFSARPLMFLTQMLGEANGSGLVYILLSVTGSLDNYAYFDPQTEDSMHQAAMLALFGVI